MLTNFQAHSAYRSACELLLHLGKNSMSLPSAYKRPVSPIDDKSHNGTTSTSHRTRRKRNSKSRKVNHTNTSTGTGSGELAEYETDDSISDSAPKSTEAEVMMYLAIFGHCQKDYFAKHPCACDHKYFFL